MEAEAPAIAQDLFARMIEIETDPDIPGRASKKNPRNKVKARQDAADEFKDKFRTLAQESGPCLTACVGR
jgi:hypothetical protein